MNECVGDAMRDLAWEIACGPQWDEALEQVSLQRRQRQPTNHGTMAYWSRWASRGLQLHLDIP